MIPIHFSHANGFPAASYRAFFDYFPQTAYRVTYINTIGSTPQYRPNWGWSNLSAELIAYIDQQHQKPVVGVGHSMGGVITLLAALKRPDLFTQIILLDPPLMGIYKQWLMRLTYLLGISGRYPPASKAKKRRTHFTTHQEALAYFKPKPLFRHFTPAVLAQYVAHGLSTSAVGKGYELLIPAALEYKLFCTTPAYYPRKPLQTPAHLIYAPSQEVLWHQDLQWIKTRFPTMQQQVFPNGTHLFPFEYPELTAQTVQNLITSPQQQENW